jgi:polysaccharide biosynthesis protein PslH
MRVLVVANQRPLPTFHGANADIWRIARALQTAGVDVACLTFRDSIADNAYLPELLATIPHYLEFPLAYGRPIDRREARRMPEFASWRRLSDEDFGRAVDFGTRFSPDCILLLGLYSGELAMNLSAALNRPLIYRSHAIETQYHEEYFRLRRSNLPGGHSWSQGRRDRSQLRAISRIEQMVVSRSRMTLEISADDMHARRRGGALRIAHLPPLVSTSADTFPIRRDTYDVCYVGNFFMPNNQNGISWFVRDVLPKVLESVGPIRVVVAGKTMDFNFVRFLENHGVDVAPNPTDVDEIIAGSTVGVNPIFAGNGTTLKTLDYLWSGCAVVTTPIGVQGFRFGDPALPLTVAGSAEAFARSIVQRLGERHNIGETRARLRRFTWERAGPQLAGLLQSVL